MSLLIFLEPLDTWFFGSARSFGAGESTHASSGAPGGLPIYGALGSAVLAHHGISLSEFKAGKIPETVSSKLGTYNDSEMQNNRFRIQGPLYSVTDGGYAPQLFFRAPANILVCGSRPYIAWPEERGEANRLCWDLQKPHPFLRPVRLPSPPHGLRLERCEEYLSQEIIQKYLKNQLLSFSHGSRNEKDFFQPEKKCGIHIDPQSWTVAEEYLFITEHLRFKSFMEGSRYRTTGLAILAHGIDEYDIGSGPLFLGGEKRQARVACYVLPGKCIPADPQVLDSIQRKKRFLVYLATPGIFMNGWHRSPWPFGAGVVMVGATVGKPEYMSGWQRSGNGAEGRPRRLYRMAPAGSVYFFEAPEWSNEQFQATYERFHCNESLSEVYASAGFGMSLIGTW